MTTLFRSTQFTLAAVLGLALATATIQPGFAEELKKPQDALVDTRTTGSIAIAGQACDPNDPDARIVCRVTHGDNSARFPAAPVNPAFGF